MKKNIALVTGGYSGEATISYRSASTIYKHLSKERFNIYTIDVTPAGWSYKDSEGKEYPIERNDFTLQLEDQKIKFDGVFIGMHGTPGEDGKLQGYFDMLRIPYTSCNAATSALTFNKRYTVAVAKMAGIGVAQSVHLFKHSPYSIDNILNVVKLPVFVKPNNGGSSIGMSKVSEGGELESALQKAFKEDDQVLVEQMIEGREFTVGVFRKGQEIIVLPITEIETHQGQSFFDFEAKYEGKSTETTPANITEDWKLSLEAAARKIYQVFNCSGVVRIDFIYNTSDNKPYMLEINTIPGQSDASVIPQQVRAAGMDLGAFYDGLLDEALKLQPNT